MALFIPKATYLRPILPYIKGVDSFLGNEVLSCKIPSNHDFYDAPEKFNFGGSGEYFPFAKIEHPNLMKSFFLASQGSSKNDPLFLVKARTSAE